MNRNKISGGIKFRELDYKSSPSQEENKPVRSKEDVLKLFASNVDDSAKENNDGDVSIQEQASFESFEEIEEISKPIVSKEIVRNVTPLITPVKRQLDVIREKPKVQSNVVDTSSLKVDHVVSSGKRIYNVMVGKISTRKHKVWDSDGILEVSGKSAVLKEVNGKYIGRTTVKPETIEEGFRLCIGGKEIEIVELASAQDIQALQSSLEPSSSESVEPPPKKAKISQGFRPVKSGTKKK